MPCYGDEVHEHGQKVKIMVRREDQSFLLIGEVHDQWVTVTWSVGITHQRQAKRVNYRGLLMLVNYVISRGEFQKKIRT